MAAHPEGPAAAFVAPLGHDVEVAIIQVQHFDATRESRISTKHLARRVLVEDTDALPLRWARILYLEVVEGFLLFHLFRSEGHVVIEIEVASERRDPLEAPAHALLVGG